VALAAIKGGWKELFAEAFLCHLLALENEPHLRASDDTICAAMSKRPPVPTLGPERRARIFGAEGLLVRIDDNYRKCVVFFGYEDSTPGKGGIFCIGTGFLIWYDGAGYLVTVKHISHQLGDNPFLIRINRRDGSAENVNVDNAGWLEHPDESVDAAATPVVIPRLSDYDVLYLDAAREVTLDRHLPLENIGVGNLTYTIGLFSFLSGEKRNLPVCHHGNIALLPSDEKIPCVDWTDSTEKRRVYLEAYLVESQSLSGLSGSPVFVRPEIFVDLGGKFEYADAELRELRKDEPRLMAGPRTQLRLLGLWQGAWEAPPDDFRAIQAGARPGNKVPLGMGVVIPANRIVEVLEMPNAKAQRARAKGGASPASTPQSIRRPKHANDDSSAALRATDANPTHREDFTRLLGAAARKPPQEV
jgi:hypothetical protein